MKRAEKKSGRNSSRHSRAGMRAACILSAGALIFAAALVIRAAVFTQPDNGSYAASGQYRALCIEPAYTSSQVAYDTNFAKSRIGGIVSGASVSVDVMTAEEFNCKNVDILDEYDYVFMGNDDAYSHVGSTLLNENPNLYYGAEIDAWRTAKAAGSKDFSVKTVDSGNDLSGKSLTALENFCKAGYPLEFATGYSAIMGSAFTGNTNETNAAHLYDYVSSLNNGDTTAFVYSELSVPASSAVSTRIAGVARNKLSLTLTEPAADSDGYVRNKQSLIYTFSITDQKASGHTYSLSFCTDNNYDGKFSEGSESVSYVGISPASNRKISVEASVLKAGVTYNMTINMSDYSGYLPWQIKVSDNADSSGLRYATEQGSCKIRADARETIRVLQLTPDNNSNYKVNVFLPTTTEMKWMAASGVTASNVATQYKKQGFPMYDSSSSSITDINKINVMYGFYKNISALSDYDIQISRVYVNDLPKAAGATGSDDIYKYLTANYDMLVLGFSDCYTDIASNDVCEAIDDFITIDGKSVLFTHDTSSMINYPDSTEFKSLGGTADYWGYHINKYFRNMLGMDRFGITLDSSSAALAGKDYNNTLYASYSSSAVWTPDASSSILDLTKLTSGQTARVTTWDPVPTATDGAINSVSSSAKPSLTGSVNVKNGMTKAQLEKLSPGLSEYVTEWSGSYGNKNIIGTLPQPEASNSPHPFKYDYYNSSSGKLQSVNLNYYYNYYEDNYDYSLGYFVNYGQYNSNKNSLTVETKTNGIPQKYTVTYGWISGDFHIYFTPSSSNGTGGYYRLTKLSGADDSQRIASRIINVSDYVTSGANRTSQGYTRSQLSHDTNGNPLGNDISTSVKKINDGPVTSYPYKIPDTLSVAKTHAQYYQLDLEDDDIVVWYALDGDPSVYSDHPGDGRNNYYIYNKGNITYSGVGHSIMSWSEDNQGEVQLFVNTMVAAYRAADSVVRMDITNWDASQDADGNASLSIGHMTSASDAHGDGIVTNTAGSVTTQYKRVKFIVYDKSIAADKSMYVDFKSVSAPPAKGASDPAGSALAYFAHSVYRSSDGAVVPQGSLQSGTEYYIYVPLSAFKDKTTVQAVITMTYKGSGTGHQKVVSYYKYVTLNNSLWFDLG